MERLEEVHRATLVEPWQPLRGAVVAQRRMIAATLVDALPLMDQKRPRTPPAPPPRPTSPADSESHSPEPDSDPLEQLARGGR
jgi:hypothetical protein